MTEPTVPTPLSADPERHVPATSAISIDQTMAASSVIVTLLCLLKIPNALHWSVDTTAVGVGAVLTSLAGVRAWWEGRVLVKGGSVLDPIGAVSATMLSLSGLLHVPSTLDLTPAAVTGIVTAAFAAIASWRHYVRRMLARRRGLA